MDERKAFDASLSRASGRYLWLALVLLILLVLSLLVLILGLKGSVDHFEGELRYRTPVPTTNTTSPSRETAAVAQTVYVPVYSHVYVHAGDPYPLTVTLSIRNTDTAHTLELTRVQYYNSRGEPVESYLDQPLRLSPLAATEFLVEERDVRGGAGASFIVEWHAEEAVTQPVIEAVMIGASGQQGISFVSPGRVIDETRRK